MSHNEDEHKMRQWIEDCGAVVSPNVFATPIADMGGGMGVIAKKNIKNGGAVVRIPAKVILTAKVARQSLADALGKRRTSDSGGESQQEKKDEEATATEDDEIKKLTPIEAICLFLLNQRFNTTNPPPDVAFWRPWISLLPHRYDNLLELELDCCSSPSSPAGGGRRAEAENFVRRHLPPRYANKVLFEIDAWHDMCAALLSKKCVQALFGGASNSGSNCFTPTQFIWAYNSLMSRGFSYDDETWAMMPWVDYFNYSTAPNLTTSFVPSAAGGCYEFKTRRAVKAGEQLLLMYGCYTDFELALWYGFTLCHRSVAVPRDVLTAKKGENEDEAEAVDNDEEMLHQSYCAYCFSPLADPNGEFPSTCDWVLELTEQVQKQVAASSSSVAEQQHQKPLDTILGPLKGSDCRITTTGVSHDVSKLLSAIKRLAAKGTFKNNAEVLRAIVQSELRLYPSSHSTSASAANEESKLEQLSVTAPSQTWVLNISRDSFGLLKFFAALDDDLLSELLMQ